MNRRLFTCAAGVLFAFAGASAMADLANYSQDFESLNAADTGALAGDGWKVFGNVFDGTNGNYLYGYGVFPAPNDGAAFSAIATGEGGVDQGAQQLSIFSDYNNGDHANGHKIESNVFQEQVVGAADVGATYTFSWDAKLGNLGGASTALAFIKTLDPGNGFALTNFITVDMTSIPTTWGSYNSSIFIDSSLENQILQFGFLNNATNYEGSGVFYDNINFAPEPSSLVLFGLALTVIRRR
ncbi:MAG: PEP-CTERM sorting domain-containing protein [Phycisphaerales bacterium]|nr:PEP-CTERM sorting domain-containing protein [Phycisphaerales bacterium]